MTAALRILVTGSRHWPNPGQVWTVLDALAAKNAGRPIVIVHGACPTGADVHAAVWCARATAAGWDVTEERHPADWALHGGQAGPIRNRAMVAAGAAVCVAFPMGLSAGTRGCMRLAREAGIPVRTVQLVAAGVRR